MTIWTNVKLPPTEAERFRRELAAHEILQSAGASANNLAAGGVDPLLAQADIAFGQPAPGQVVQLPKLRWLQLTTAGYTRYDTREFRDAMRQRGTIVCNASSVYAEPCAQHVLAMMLSLNRRLPMALDNQRGGHKWPYLPLRAESKLLNGQTVLLVGYGAIARRLARLLAPFEMNVVGFKRRPAGDEGAVRLVPIAQLDDWLAKADHIVNILPASAETEEFFHADRFARMKRGAFYYNIGRGSTNDEYALWTALETRTIAAAYIDAFMEEPLPPHHPLWSMPHCFITPHTAGGDANEYDRHVDLFLNNLREFQSGSQNLIDRIM